MSQKIEIKKGFGGSTYKQDGKPINQFKIYSLLNADPDISVKLKKVMPLYILSFVLTIAGSFLVGYNIVFGLMTTGISWGEVGVGAILAVGGFMLSKGPSRQFDELIERYNTTVE